MPYKKLFLLISFSCTYEFNSYTYLNPRIQHSLFASAVGDALGRVTEFVSSVEGIFERYPKGVTCFQDFIKRDWSSIPSSLRSHQIAPYTDDTRMALLVCETLVNAKQANWDLETTMSELAHAFIRDLNQDYGWAAGFRAPGNACLNGVLLLQQRASKKNAPRWWDVKASQAGGCGSVMRAFPFGLIFYDNPEKAKHWAVEHSKLSHGHPIALAACAAMAVGTAQAVEGLKNHHAIISAMIEAAKEYDPTTAQKMRTAVDYAKKAQTLLEHCGGSIEKAFLDKNFKAFHKKVFNEFQGWAAHDAIAATVYVFALFPNDIKAALYVGVHTPGDSDSIAAMSGSLIGAYANSHDELLQQEIEDAQWIETLAQKIDALHTQDLIRRLWLDSANKR